MVRARNVAIVHVCVESVALLFCRSGWCVVAALIAIPPSSSIACCCKRRGCYTLWGISGSVIFSLHAVAAATEAISGDDPYDGNPNAFIFMVQVALCFLGLVVVRHSIKLAPLVREPVLPVDGHGGDMEVTPHVVYQSNGVPYAQAT